ncbi:S24 family peptidase [Neisseriaceae bacterium TC5R-5]|nr:S24 family peptidase [Neisseriaceae bacterium TC5R-5]
MEIAKIRQARLKEWFTGKDSPKQRGSAVSQWLHGKPMGERAARNLETRLGMPPNFLDEPLDVVDTEADEKVVFVAQARRQKRLQFLLDTRFKGVQADLARAIQRDQSQVNLYFSGKVVMGEVLARDIEKVLGLPSGWLDEEGEVLPMPDLPPPMKRPRSGNESWPKLPTRPKPIPLLLGIQYVEAREKINPDVVIGWLLSGQTVSDQAFALTLADKSMSPDFKPGDIVIIDPAVSPQPGDFVVAIYDGQTALFRKYRPRGQDDQGEEVVKLSPINADYASLRAKVAQLAIMGTMVEYRRYRQAHGRE